MLPLALVLALMVEPVDHGYGPVEPATVPPVRVTTHTGRPVNLRDLLRGRRTAVQFIFVSCQTACPLLGSLFHRVDTQLDDSAALLSITVDPEHDTPARLREFLERHEASGRWTAVRAARRDLAALLRLFGQQDGPPTGHTMKVFFTDEQARYTGRTVMLPQAAGVLRVLRPGVEPRVLAKIPTATEATGADIYHGRAKVEARVNGELLTGAAAACVNCHGAQRQGVAEGRTQPSPLTATALGGKQARRGGPPSAYDGEALCRTLATGVDAAGVMLAQTMPRYALTAGQCQALSAFLLEPSH